MRNAARPISTVRIVGGDLRGSKLAVADRDGLRPTPDRVRETLFNWLAPTIAGARCLDLFAGTGALGIEAISRGAAHCSFVERDRDLAQALRGNLARLRVETGEVVEADALDWLAKRGAAFDIVFLDPPFARDLWKPAALALEEGGGLREGAFIYVESPLDAAFVLPANWALHREGRAGAVRYALYRRTAADPLS
jgi:16S rRNA (guanine966-N2)-methyltransferase